jgi:quinoprotein glucose dehydrogenase
MAMTSPPLVFNDMVVQGAMVMDNQRADSPGGVIRAWDARTGALRWAFDPVPPGAPSPQAIGAPDGQRYHFGTPNSWGISSADPQRNLIFVPFGSPGLDFVGGHRKRHGFDLAYYANSVVALNALTGEVVWHFQVVHQDLWDYDVAAQPVLIDIEKDGKKIPALVQATKMGHLFILNRETGEPLYPVEERPVPQTNIPGEYTSPTQPFPTFPQPLHPYGLNADDAWGFTFYDRQACQKKIEAADNSGIFTPPALNRHTIEYPGVAGGQNWGGLAYDRNNNLLIMPQNYVVAYNMLVPRERITVGSEEFKNYDYSPNLGTPYVVKHEILLSPFGVPCIAPPWGTLLAVSLDTGKITWQVPFGTPRDMVSVMSWFPFFPDMGLPSAGGPIVTDTGLVFVGATLDDYIRAYDARDGAELWRHRLPAGGQATPMTYRGAKSGRQFVVIAAGGHATMRTQLGDTLMAFSLAD